MNLLESYMYIDLKLMGESWDRCFEIYFFVWHVDKFIFDFVQIRYKLILWKEFNHFCARDLLSQGRTTRDIICNLNIIQRKHIGWKTNTLQFFLLTEFTLPIMVEIFAQ